MIELTGMTCEELTEWARENGYPAFRGRQIFRWIHQGVDFDGMTNLPISMREKLKEEAIAQPVSIRLHRTSRLDGTVKFLYALRDGNCVEGVLMRYKYGISLCISTQVGCRMGCRFCASTLDGLVRNLTAGEMLGEILQANRFLQEEKQTVSHVVLMGSGEPLDNYDEVIRFLRLLREEEGVREEWTGLHEREFIETRRYWLDRKLSLDTEGGVSVMNLVEGEEAVITSPTGAFAPYVVHYAETFIVPAAVGAFEIAPYGLSEGKTIGVIRAYVRT